jgi:hypothetical protein
MTVNTTTSTERCALGPLGKVVTTENGSSDIGG